MPIVWGANSGFGSSSMKTFCGAELGLFVLLAWVWKKCRKCKGPCDHD